LRSWPELRIERRVAAEIPELDGVELADVGVPRAVAD
jgi:hypothetical protein